MSISQSQYILSLRATSPEYIKRLVETAAVILEELTLTFNPEGVKFRSMDPSHVALIDAFIPSSLFERYSCENELKVALRISDLEKVLRRADSKDAVEINLAKERSAFNFIFQNGYRREFQIHLIESSGSETPLPKISFNSRVTITQPMWRRVLGDIEVVSDHIKIICEGDKISFYGKGDSGDGRAELAKGCQDLLEFEVREASEASGSTYSLDYLSKIAREAGGETVTIELSSKTPLKQRFKVGDGGFIDSWLAPRVEEP